MTYEKKSINFISCLQNFRCFSTEKKSFITAMYLALSTIEQLVREVKPTRTREKRLKIESENIGPALLQVFVELT